MLRILFVLFTVSGAAGLIYEAIWSRYLGLFVGHSAYAQIIVLVIFLGGMSLGAYLTGRRSERLRDPLRWYAVAELGAGLLGVVFHPLFTGVTNAAYASLFPALPAGAPVVAAKWLIAALLILPQSVLLGATFPLMSAGVIRRAPAAPGRALALLYFTNSLGAAAGVLAAGFWLLPAVGLPGTLLAAAAINGAVALGALAVSVRGARRRPSPPAGDPTWPRRAGHAADRAGGHAPWARLARVSAALGGRSEGRCARCCSSRSAPRVASFVYEVAWLRMLALVVGQRHALVRDHAVGVHPRARVGAPGGHGRADRSRSRRDARHRAVGHGQPRDRHAPGVRRVVLVDGLAAPGARHHADGYRLFSLARTCSASR
jgi:MFS family permease